MIKRLTNIVLIAALSSTTALFAGFPETDKILAQDIKEDGQMNAKDLKVLLDAGKPVVILDVRETEQRAEGTIYAYEAYAITRGNLEFSVGNKIKNKDAVIVTFCRSGHRGVMAAHTLRQLGYKNAVSLKGGLKGWAKLGYPVETGMGVSKFVEVY